MDVSYFVRNTNMFFSHDGDFKNVYFIMNFSEKALHQLGEALFCQTVITAKREA